MIFYSCDWTILIWISSRSNSMAQYTTPVAKQSISCRLWTDDVHWLSCSVVVFFIFQRKSLRIVVTSQISTQSNRATNNRQPSWKKYLSGIVFRSYTLWEKTWFKICYWIAKLNFERKVTVEPSLINTVLHAMIQWGVLCESTTSN